MAIETNKLKTKPINPAPEPNKIRILPDNLFFFKARIPPAKTENAPREATISMGMNRSSIPGKFT